MNDQDQDQEDNLNNQNTNQWNISNNETNQNSNSTNNNNNNNYNYNYNYQDDLFYNDDNLFDDNSTFFNDSFDQNNNDNFYDFSNLLNTENAMTSNFENTQNQNPESPTENITDKIFSHSYSNDTDNDKQKFEINSKAETRIILQEENHHSSPYSGSTRNPKRKVELSEEAILFKEGFYKIFQTRRKKFPKQLVKQIHNQISDKLNMNKMPREFERRIDLYFQAYSSFSNIILHYLQVHKEELLEEIPELQELN